MAHSGFNARNVTPMQGRGDPLPAGWYVFKITESELVNTKSGTGLRLNLTAEVLHSQVGGPVNNGRKAYIGLNMRNDNPKAAEIGQQELSAIAHAVGVLDVQSSEQLHNIPFWGRLRVRAADGQYEASNEFMNYQNQTFVPPTPLAAAPAMAPAKQAAAAPAAAAGFGQGQATGAAATGFGGAATAQPATPAGFGMAQAPAQAPAPAPAPVVDQAAQPWATAPAAAPAASAPAVNTGVDVGGVDTSAAPWAQA